MIVYKNHVKKQLVCSTVEKSNQEMRPIQREQYQIHKINLSSTSDMNNKNKTYTIKEHMTNIYDIKV